MLAELERDREPAAGHLVERVAEQRRVLRLLRELAVERRRSTGTRASACRPPSSAGRASREHRRGRDRALLDGGQDRPLPRLLELLELERGRRGGAGATRSALLRPVPGHRSGASAVDRDGRMRPRCSSCSSRNASDSRERSAPGRVTLTSASSSGRRGSPPWRMSSTATASRSISRSTGRLAELVRLRAQPLARLLGHRQRLGHLAHVLHEQQMPQVLEQIGDEPAEVLPLLGQLLDERERAGRVAVDDEVEQPEQRFLLDGAEPLQHRLHGDRPLASRRRAGRASTPRRGTRRAPSARSARAPGRARRSSRRPRSAGACARDRAAAAARRRRSGSASGRWAAPSRGRSCRRRRRGGAEAPRSASAARSTRRP